MPKCPRPIVSEKFTLKFSYAVDTRRDLVSMSQANGWKASHSQQGMHIRLKLYKPTKSADKLD